MLRFSGALVLAVVLAVPACTTDQSNSDASGFTTTLPPVATPDEPSGSDLPDRARTALLEHWDSLPSDPDIEHRIIEAWLGQPPGEEPNLGTSPIAVWCVEAEISSDDPEVDGSRMVWIVTRRGQESNWSAALLASLSSTWPYEACARTD